MQPGLTLSYNSMAGTGLAGMGWNVTSASIERSRLEGTPARPGSQSEDRYTFSLKGAGGELQRDTDGSYRAEIERVFLPFRKENEGTANESWSVFDGRGMQYRFGTSPDSRIDGELWLLDSIIDPHGNTVTYHYARECGSGLAAPCTDAGNETIYLSEIRYAGYPAAGDPGANRVVIEYESRPDRRVSYLRGVREAQNLRIRRISAWAQSDLVRRYQLYYSRYANGSSLLSGIDLVGADDSSTVTLRTLEYGERPFGWAADRSTNLPGGLFLLDDDGAGTGVSLVDINGDGFADVVGNEGSVYLGDGAGGFGAKNTRWSDSFPDGFTFVSSNGIDTGVRLQDVNGDGRPDIFIARQISQTTSVGAVYLNNGFEWQKSTPWSDNVATLSALKVAYVADNYSAGCLAPHCDTSDPTAGCTPNHCIPEIPGDDDTPTVPANPSGCSVDNDNYIAVHCSESSTHTGFFDPEAENCVEEDHCQAPVFDVFDPFNPPDSNEKEPFAFVGLDGESKGVELADVNGDGLVDIVWSFSFEGEFFLFETPRFVRAVFLNGGDDNPGWHSNNALAAALAEIRNDSGDSDFFVVENQYRGYAFMDVNGDGYNDIVRSVEGGQAVYLGNGTGWAYDSGYTSSMIANNLFAQDTGQKSQGLMPMDLNDDGLLDIVLATISDDDPATYSASAFVNTGAGWMPQPGIAPVLESRKVAFANEKGLGTGITMSDINGDGVGDLVTAIEGGGQNRIALSTHLRSGKLVRTTTTLGEANTIEWTSSTRFNNRQPSGKEGLPFAMTVAKRLTRSDGRGSSLVTEINYARGLYLERSFRGFGWVEQTPSAGLRSEMVFYQDEDRIGQPIESSAFDSSGNLRVRITTEMEIEDSHDFVRQVRLFSSDTERFDPGGSTHTRVLNYYNDRLQITRTIKDPEVGPAGDEGTITTTFARNDVVGIWDLPVRNQVIDPGGDLLTETITLYDGLPQGQVSKGLPSETREYVGPGEYVGRSFDYDGYGNPVAVRDRAGQLTLITYDQQTSTFRVQSEDAEGRIRRSEYDPRFGLLMRDENASGHATITQYDAFGRMTRVTAPGDEASTYGSTSFVYSPLGDPETQFMHMRATENAGTRDVFESTTLFDGLGRIYETHKEGPDGKTVVNLVEFGADGKPSATSMPFFVGEQPVMATTDRDDLGRSTRVVDSLGQSTRIRYRGAQIELENSLGFTSTWTSNTDGDLEEIRMMVDGNMQTTDYRYDVLGRLVMVIDAMGNETRIAYDGLGRRIRLDDPNVGTFHYRYDGEGRLVEQVNPDGNSMLLHYSATGDLLKKELPDGTIQTFRYGDNNSPNAVGRVVEVEDASGILKLEYDRRGNVVERLRTVDGRTFVTGFIYDSLDRVRRITYPDGFTADYHYDDGNNLAAITDPDGRPLADGFEYNASSRITRFAFGNGVSTNFSYDDLARMVSSRTETGAGVDIQELLYAFDAANNVLSLDDLITGASQQFEYDEANRLTRAAGPYGEESYEYDAIGNLVRKGNLYFGQDPQFPQRVNCAAEVGDNKVKGEKGLSAIDPCVASLASIDLDKVNRSFTLGYDSLGNVTQKGSRSFEYDGENRLIRVSEANGRLIEHNRYDASGELVVKATQSETRIYIDGLYEEGQSHVSRHIFAGPLLVATLVVPRAQVTLIETARVTDVRLHNMASISILGFLLLSLLALDRYFGWRIARALAGIGEACRARPVNVLMVLVIVMSSWPTAAMAGKDNKDGGEKRYYYHANHLGSVNVVTDDDGRVTARRDYRPYGESHDWSGAKAGPRELLHTFQGQKFDDTSGLYHFKARHYDAELGRFMSADTIVASLDDPRTLHRYAFAGGNPVKFIDPTGRSFWSSIGDAFESAGNWIAENAVEIITIVAVVTVLAVLTVFTGGLGTAILVGAAVGFAAGGLAATAAGYSVTDSEFWITAGVGAGIGALVGATWYLPSTSALLKAGASKWAIGGQLAVEGALTGAIFGGAEGIIAGAVSGASVEETLRLFNQGAAVGALIGSLAGPLGFGVKGAGSAGKALVYFGKAGSVGKLAFAGFASADTRRPTTLGLTGGEGNGNQYLFSGVERRANDVGNAIAPVAIIIGLGIADGLLTLSGYPDLITYPATN